MKDIIYINIIVILLIIEAIVLSTFKEKNDQLKKSESIIEEKNATIQYYITKDKRTVAEKDAAIATAEQFKNAYPALANEIIKSFDIKIKDLRAYVRNEFEAHGSGNAVTNNHYYIDSTVVRHSIWELKASDGYLDFRATVIDSLHAPYEYQYTDTITTAIAIRKKWFAGKERLYATSELRNPNAKIIGTTNVLIKDYRDKRWVISAGVSYIPFTNTFQPTVSFGYALIKF